jgi:cbb3-type cytochrome oxidase maturation protein
MAVIFLVLPLAILLAAVGVIAFMWAVRKGQYDDLTTPSVRMLFEDEE